MKTGFTCSCFDLFHAGHIMMLKEAKSKCDYLIVGLQTDPTIDRPEKNKPIQSVVERFIQLESCKYVDEVIPNSEGEDSKPTILSVNPKFIVIGSDWAKKDYYKQMNFTQKWLDDNEIVLIYLPYTEDVSTTAIKKRLKLN